MNKKYALIIKHALGLDYRSRPFRNRYLCHVDGIEYPRLLKMVKDGLLEIHGTINSFTHFGVTDAGYRYVGAEVEEGISNE